MCIIKIISKDIKKLKYVPKDLQSIEVALSDIYYANFSVFQSLHDSWALAICFRLYPFAA